MEIFFRKSSVEDDSASIVNFLSLGTEHQRVKKYICEYFDLPVEELAKKSKADLEKVIARVVQSEQIESAETIDGKIETIDTLWKSEKQKISRILCNVFECQEIELLLTAFLSVNCVCHMILRKNRFILIIGNLAMRY